MQPNGINTMWVSGCGKTTIGKQLSHITSYSFNEADSFHPKENIDKMNADLPLTAADRWPWLQKIHAFVTEQDLTGSIIMACSALKKDYLELLEKSMEENCYWVFLEGDFKTIRG